MRKIAREEFMQRSNLEEEAKKRFKDNRVVASAIEVGKSIGSIASLDDLDDVDYVNDLKELVLTVAPHKMLVDKLREVAEEDVEEPLSAIVKLFSDVKVAEIASLGQIAKERIDVIKKLEHLVAPGSKTEERDLQKMLEDAPWLIDPQWTVLQANKTFETMRKSFERWYEKEYKKEIVTSTVDSGKKRPDFILLHIGSNVEIVEIKNVDHTLSDNEFDNVLKYYSAMEGFLEKNPRIKKDFPFLHVSLICDKLDLQEMSSQLSYKKLYDDNLLKKKTWEELLNDTCKVHEAFLTIAKP